MRVFFLLCSHAGHAKTRKVNRKELLSVPSAVSASAPSQPSPHPQPALNMSSPSGVGGDVLPIASVPSHEQSMLDTDAMGPINLHHSLSASVSDTPLTTSYASPPTRVVGSPSGELHSGTNVESVLSPGALASMLFVGPITSVSSCPSRHPVQDPPVFTLGPACDVGESSAKDSRDLTGDHDRMHPEIGNNILEMLSTSSQLPFSSSSVLPDADLVLPTTEEVKWGDKLLSDMGTASFTSAPLSRTGMSPPSPSPSPARVPVPAHANSLSVVNVDGRSSVNVDHVQFSNVRDAKGLSALMCIPSVPVSP